jgi:hypothetical protein
MRYVKLCPQWPLRRLTSGGSHKGQRDAQSDPADRYLRSPFRADADRQSDPADPYPCRQPGTADP